MGGLVLRWIERSAQTKHRPGDDARERADWRKPSLKQRRSATSGLIGARNRGRTMAGDAGTTITWWAIFSTLGGTIVGSIIGGTTSYLLQRKSLKAAKVQHDEDRLEVRKALAYSPLFKMIQIASGTQVLHNHLENAFQKAKAEGLDGDAWRFVLPLANQPDRVKFSAEEMALLLSLKDNKLFNEMMPCDEIYNSTLQVFDHYKTLRRTLTDMPPIEISGTRGTIRLTAEDALKIAPRIIELNELIADLQKRLPDDSKETARMVLDLHGLLRKHFKFEFKLKMKEATT
jgi:hypothetical protein